MTSPAATPANLVGGCAAVSLREGADRGRPALVAPQTAPYRVGLFNAPSTCRLAGGTQASLVTAPAVQGPAVSIHWPWAAGARSGPARQRVTHHNRKERPPILKALLT
jgi:hypothetical protein